MVAAVAKGCTLETQSCLIFLLKTLLLLQKPIPVLIIHEIRVVYTHKRGCSSKEVNDNLPNKPSCGRRLTTDASVLQRQHR